jgi:hypothetical protein
LNFIFGIVCLFVCVCAFSLRRESPDMILGDKPLIFEVVLSQCPDDSNQCTSYMRKHDTHDDNISLLGQRDGRLGA